MQTTNLTTNQALVAGGVLGGMFAVFGIIALVWYVLLIIGWWKMFEKAGEKGWKSLIPVYNYYISYKIAGMMPWLPVIFFFIAPVILGICFPNITTVTNTENAQVVMSSTNTLGIILSCVIAIISLVISIVWCFKTSKAFKRGIGTAILLIFFPNIMAMVLGFGKAKYDKSAKYGA